MRSLHTLTLLAAALLANPTQAQITLVNTATETIFPLGSLGAGVRYITPFYPGTSTSGFRNLYNMDLSPYRVLNYPAPPANMTWASMGYITDALFDTDAATIEFAIVAMPASGPGNFAVFVYREDGTELFSQNPGSLTNGVTFVNSYGPVFATEEGTFMTVHTSNVSGPPVNIYQLPGSLPCIDCHGTPHADGLGLGQADITEPFSGMTVLPNPAQDEVRILFSAGGAPVDLVTVVDAAGREVLRTSVTDRSMLTLGVAHLTNGRYTVVGSNRMQRMSTLPLVIAR